MVPKGVKLNLNPKFQIYVLEKEIKNSRDHLCSSNPEKKISSIRLLL
jgi:hypothetical protein